MKKFIMLLLCIGIMIPSLVFANANITVNWTGGSESDLSGHYVYFVIVNKGDTTGNHILKKDGGTPNATVLTPDSSIIFSDQIDGFYAVVVTSFDDAGNESIKSSEVIERIDTTPPIILLNGSDTMEIDRGTTFVDPGATASDNLDGDITSLITVTGSVDTSQVGSSVLTYTVLDETPLTASITRIVNIVDNAPPDPPTNVNVLWEQFITWLRCKVFGKC